MNPKQQQYISPTGAENNVTFEMVVLRHLEKVLNAYVDASSLEKEDVFKYELALKGFIALLSAVTDFDVSFKKSSIDLSDKRERAEFLEKTSDLLKACIQSLSILGITPTQIATLILAGNVFEAKEAAKRLMKTQMKGEVEADMLDEE